MAGMRAQVPTSKQERFTQYHVPGILIYCALATDYASSFAAWTKEHGWNAGTNAKLKAGEVYTVKELLYALMLPSGNDASICLAEVGNTPMNVDRAFVLKNCTVVAVVRAIDRFHQPSCVDVQCIARTGSSRNTALQDIPGPSCAHGGNACASISLTCGWHGCTNSSGRLMTCAFQNLGMSFKPAAHAEVYEGKEDMWDPHSAIGRFVAQMNRTVQRCVNQNGNILQNSSVARHEAVLAEKGNFFQ